jgi:ribosomal protein L40E
MPSIRQLIARLLAWRPGRRRVPPAPPGLIPFLVAYQPAIHREVTASGVRFFSVCGSCGARLGISATLCDECAQRRSRLT